MQNKNTNRTDNLPIPDGDELSQVGFIKQTNAQRAMRVSRIIAESRRQQDAKQKRRQERFNRG
jgi:hypothetical protein